MIVVTGGSGKLGRVVVRDLMAHKYEVTSIDMVAPPGLTNPPTPGDVSFSRVDITDFGQVMAALSGIDDRIGKVQGIVHLGAIAAPGQAPDHVIFATNSVSTYNVFEAARRLGIRNIVWASSETVYGIPYDNGPHYLPVDEEISRPETAYALSKMVGEEIAEQFCRWDKRLKIVGLRFSNVMAPEDYSRFPDHQKDPHARRFNLWTYIDARDGAQAVRKALEANLKGAHVFGIANADSVMELPNEVLLEKVYPKARRTRAIKENESLISIEKARSVLGYRPRHSWRKELAAVAEGEAATGQTKKKGKRLAAGAARSRGALKSSARR